MFCPFFRIQITGGLICKNYLGLGSQCRAMATLCCSPPLIRAGSCFFNALWQAYTPEQFFCCLSRLFSLFVIEFHRVHHIFQSIEQGGKDGMPGRLQKPPAGGTDPGSVLSGNCPHKRYLR